MTKFLFLNEISEAIGDFANKAFAFYERILEFKTELAIIEDKSGS